MQDFHQALSFITPTATAIAVSILLVLMIIYLGLSRYHRPQGVQRSGRATLTVGAGIGMIWTGGTVYNLNSYNRAWEGYPGASNLLPQFSMAAVIAAVLTLLITVLLSIALLLKAWKGSTRRYRVSLLLGVLTLVSASLSVAASCWCYALPFGSSTADFMNYTSVYSRGFAVLAGVAFAIMLLTGVRELIMAFRFMRTIDAIRYLQLPRERRVVRKQDSKETTVPSGRQ